MQRIQSLGNEEGVVDIDESTTLSSEIMSETHIATPRSLASSTWVRMVSTFVQSECQTWIVGFIVAKFIIHTRHRSSRLSQIMQGNDVTGSFMVVVLANDDDAVLG